MVVEDTSSPDGSARPGPISLPWRTHMAAIVGGAVGALSRATGHGSGSVVGGHAVLAIDPRALERLSAGREVALVSGTNGKTTTTKLLSTALAAGRGGGERTVVTNLLGANLPTGLAAALAAGTPGATAVLEVDEAWLASVCTRTQPKLLVLLNLSRDQLDRNNEVRHVAHRWREACRLAGPGSVVVANADDPLVVWAASAAPRVTWVGAGLRWNHDAAGCPQCGGPVQFEPVPVRADVAAPGSISNASGSNDAGWRCGACGFSRPSPDIWLGPEGVHEGRVLFGSGQQFSLPLGLPGRCNQANAAMALAGAIALGADIDPAMAAMGSVHEVAGRYATVLVGATRCRLLLAKNPAGWAEVFDMVAPAPAPLVISINARTADGHDPSWLWDVPFEWLRGRRVVATGERRLDLAVRLHYAEVEHTLEPGPVAAVQAAGARELDVVANYTAFHQFLAHLRNGPSAR
jgi:lipid II isoglutaminyl synthase (glutamine-hydrolysing)